MADKQVRIPSGSKPGSNFSPLEVYEIGLPGLPGELIIHNGKLYVYGTGGVTLIDGGIIQTEAILANSITADKLTIGNQTFSHDIVWTATDEDTASWSSGTIVWADGSTSSINSGNTGNITATTYIYYDGTSTLQTTTTAADAVGDNKRMLAIVEEGGAGGKTVITPMLSTGTTIDGNKIVTGRIQSLDTYTYFDLNDGVLVVDEATITRLVLGNI
jgi:hypothetical protein